MPRFRNANGFPADLHLPTGRLVLKYTRHALKSAEKDRHGDLRYGLPGEVLAHNHRPVEVETAEDGRVTKAVYRIGLSKGLDIVLAMSPRHDRWVVRTVYAQAQAA